jgi:hypothetical protein
MAMSFVLASDNARLVAKLEALASAGPVERHLLLRALRRQTAPPAD